MARAASGAVTLRDVAERVGVSVRTVSNVVTGSATVRDETRLRVERAVAELGYRPNIAARRLRSGRAQAIGLVLPDVTVPYFREFADDVLAAAHRHGMAVVVEQIHGDPAREMSVFSSPRLRHVDGIVFTSVALGTADLVGLPASARPVVMAGAGWFDGPLDVVTPDQYGAGQAVGDALGRLGPRRPVVLTGDAGAVPWQSSARYRGFVDGLAARGVGFDDSSVMRVEAVTLEVGRSSVAAVLGRWPDVDAIFANADALALGVLRGLKDAGLRVPEDVAVVGFGNVEYAAHSRPTLTTVDTSRAAAATAAVQIILDRQQDRESAPRRVDIGFRLFERESTGVFG